MCARKKRNSHLSIFPLYAYLQIPRSLYKDDGYDHREALFGIPMSRGSMSLNVFYAQQDLCESVDSSLGVPSRPIDSQTGKMEAWPSPYILMVDRGGCTFVKKVCFFDFHFRSSCPMFLGRLIFS
jgi:hypothetical protein